RLPPRRRYRWRPWPPAIARSRQAPADSRNDGGLQVTVVAHEVAHHFEQVGERLLAIDEVPGGDVAVADDVERLADMRRGVMEAGLAGDLGVVEQGSVQAHAALIG